jgi:hypothetical protein
MMVVAINAGMALGMGPPNIHGKDRIFRKSKQ